MLLRRLIVVIIFLSSALMLRATHIKGGHIEYEEIATNTFKFTFTGYRDINGVIFGNEAFHFGDGSTFGGLDGETIPWEHPVYIGNGTEVWKFEVTHTYEDDGMYIASYAEDFRNADIINIDASLTTRFYTEALVTVSSELGMNSSPIFKIPDLEAAAGETYWTSFSVTDPDGDSLTYGLVTPKQAADLNVNNYRLPNNPEFYADGPGLFSLDRKTGNLIWETENIEAIPINEKREFLISMEVLQWRDGVLIGRNSVDYNINLWNIGAEGEAISIDFPSSRSYDSTEGILMDTIRIASEENLEISALFNTEDDRFIVNNMTVSEWNNQTELNRTVDEIAISFDPNDQINSSRLSYLQMIFSYRSEMVTITNSQTLFYGLNYNFEVVLSTPDTEVVYPEFKIYKGKIELLNNNDTSTILLVDLNGQVLLKENIPPTRKEIPFYFEKNKIYFLTLVSKSQTQTQKFMFK